MTHFNNAELRRRTAQELLGGNHAPFLALLGVSLASGNGILTKEDEIECVCTEVREASRKARDALQEHEIQIEEASWSVNDFEVGSAISKGCSAVVYAAKCVKKGFEDLGCEGQSKDQE